MWYARSGAMTSSTKVWPGCCRWTPRWCAPISTRPVRRVRATRALSRITRIRRSPSPTIGRCRGGLTTKIHALTDTETCPVPMSLTAGQAGDNPQLLPLVDGYFGAEHTTDSASEARLVADKAYSHPSTRTAPHRAAAGSATPFPSVTTRSPGARPRAQPAGAHRRSTPQSTSSATPLNAASTGSNNGAVGHPLRL